MIWILDLTVYRDGAVTKGLWGRSFTVKQAASTRKAVYPIANIRSYYPPWQRKWKQSHHYTLHWTALGNDKKSETRVTASILRQDPNTQTVLKLQARMTGSMSTGGCYRCCNSVFFVNFRRRAGFCMQARMTGSMSTVPCGQQKCLKKRTDLCRTSTLPWCEGDRWWVVTIVVEDKSLLYLPALGRMGRGRGGGVELFNTVEPLAWDYPSFKTTFCWNCSLCISVCNNTLPKNIRLIFLSLLLLKPFPWQCLCK